MLFPSSTSSRTTPFDCFPSSCDLCSHKIFDGFHCSSCEGNHHHYQNHAVGRFNGGCNFILDGICVQPASPYRCTNHGGNQNSINLADNVQIVRHQAPSSTLHEDKAEFAMNQTFRDFSGIPPTEEDHKRYNKKKKEYTKKLTKGPNDNEGRKKFGGHDPIWDKRGRGNREAKDRSNRFIGFMGTNFPARLHDLLSHDEDISDIITWLPHGRSWIVRDKKEFLSKVAPSHFQISKYESFIRQVNGWGFKRITQGPDINSYYHELFLRGMPHLIQWMKRSTSSGPRRKQIRSDPRKEPNFYAISQMYPIPDYYGEESGNDGNLPAVDHPTVTTEVEESSARTSETTCSIAKSPTSNKEEEKESVSKESMTTNEEDTLSSNDVERIKDFWITSDTQNHLNGLEAEEFFDECTNLSFIFDNNSEILFQG